MASIFMDYTIKGNSMILITGGNGQLGYDVIKVCQEQGLEYSAPTSLQLNLMDKESINRYFQQQTIESVIHCAAYTAVDLAEDEKEKCYAINVVGTKDLMLAAQTQGAKFLLVSTDYVFDGTKDLPYEIEDKLNPIGVYAHSKALAEEIVGSYAKTFIVRISWVFGIHGKNFVKTMLRIGKDKEMVSVVSDQWGSPTYSVDAAKVIVDMIQTDKYGIYHVTNEGYTHWANFAQKIFEKAHYQTKVKEILTIDYPTKAKRPLNSRLSKNALTKNGFNLLPSWEDAIDRYIVELKNAGELL